MLHELNAHLEGKSPYNVEYRLRTDSGDYRWFKRPGAGRPRRERQGRSRVRLHQGRHRGPGDRL